MLRLAMAAVFAMSSEGVAGQPDTLGSIGLYQEGAHSFVFIATQEPVTYSLTPDSDAGQYVLSLQGKGISELMRRALRRPDLLTTGIVESFAMIDADHVDVLLRSPPEGLELKDVSGTNGMDHCVLVGVAHSAFPAACPTGKSQPLQTSKLNQGIYEIFVNGEDEGAAIVLSSGDGEFLFDADDLKSWRINPAFADSLDHVIYEDKKYVSVSHAQGVTVMEDAKASAIRITFNPSDFQVRRVLELQLLSAIDPGAYHRRRIARCECIWACRHGIQRFPDSHRYHRANDGPVG
jgi:hypothetical protein